MNAAGSSRLTPLLIRARDDRIHLRAEDGHIVAAPKDRVTPQLQGVLRENKAELLELLRWGEEAAYALVKDAMAYLAEFYIKGGKPDYDYQALDSYKDAVEEAYAACDMFALRIAVRELVEATLRAFRAAGQKGAA